MLSIASSLIPGDLFTKLETIAEAGFGAIELYEPDLLSCSGSSKEIGDRAKSLGLVIEVFQPSHDLESMLQASRENAMPRLEHTLDLMQQLGAKTLLVGARSDQDGSQDHERLCSDYADLAEKVAGRNLRAALMALPWGRHIHNEMQALSIVETVNNPALGLGLNSLFSLSDGSQPSRLRVISGERIYHVQLTDAPAIDYDSSRLKKHRSLLPGQGELPLASFVRIIARSGYVGPWSLSSLSDATPRNHANYGRDGYRALVTLLDEAAQIEPALSKPLPNLPSRVYPKGFDFIEFTVDQAAHSQLIKVLNTLCFRHERQHVSKPIELWRQGAVNIVINPQATDLAREVFAEHGPSICDLGFRVQDANQAVLRATALGTPEFSHPVSTGELSIPGIKGVGGSVYHFIDEHTDLHRVLDLVFDPLPKVQATPSAGLRRIDHISQTMRYQEMQSWLTYYTSTFVMEKTSVVDVADPSGIILSQAMASPEGEVRLNLNGAGEGRTFAGAFLADQFGAGVQHIAFQSDDIFETSDLLEQAGFSRLLIPDNYYADLQVRTGLPSSMVKRLRKANILYDQEGDGEYLQIYSTPFFRGFFLEIVERRGSYQGYGRTNAPIRLAAQMRFMKERETS